MVSHKNKKPLKERNATDSDSELNPLLINVDNRPLLINVDMMGSGGPIRLFVCQNHTVSKAIRSALVANARKRRVPISDFNADHYLLYSSTHDDGWEPMEPTGTMGLQDCRNFVLCKNPSTRRHRRTFKNWFNKSFLLNISH